MESPVSSYCHTVPGRMRVKVTGLKGNQSAARSLELLLGGQSDIKHVRANHLTSSVLVQFDHSVISHEDVLVWLEDLGHLPLIPDRDRDARQSDALASLGLMVCANLAKVALKQAPKGTSVCLLVELF